MPQLILSSPFQRCVQTVAPLAGVHGLEVVEDDGLIPDRSPRAIRKAFDRVGDACVVCTHGEVIARLFDERVKCAKGAFWVVERRDGELRPMRYVGVPVRRRNTS